MATIAARARAETHTTLTVRLYNTSGTPADELAAARSVADAILLDARIRAHATRTRVVVIARTCRSASTNGCPTVSIPLLIPFRRRRCFDREVRTRRERADTRDIPQQMRASGRCAHRSSCVARC